MAKEGVEKAEETEQMIEKEPSKEPAEGGGGDGSHRLGDAQEMRAVVLAGFGGLNKLRLSRKAMPEPQDGELKIRVKACGLNFIDLMVRQGNIDNPPKTPLVPGFECSGIVEALGDSVKGYEIGDRVMAFVNYNAWAEVVCTPVEFVYKIPDDMSFSEAAAFPMNFVTAYMMLFEVANLREGMSVLVHSAGGGVGQAVAQLCSTVPNVTVFGTASTFKHEAIKDSVTHLFDRNADYVQEVKRISAEGVDIVLDCLCGDNTGKGLSLLKPLGTYILYGSSNMVTGETKSFFSFAKSWWQVEKVNPIKLYEENKVIAGFSLLHLLFKQGRAGLVRGVVDRLIGLYNQKKIKPVVDSLWALEEWNPKFFSSTPSPCPHTFLISAISSPWAPHHVSCHSNASAPPWPEPCVDLLQPCSEAPSRPNASPGLAQLIHLWICNRLSCDSLKMFNPFDYVTLCGNRDLADASS
ncbi:synaptic vesicle membrane protein VAT-1 homolog-like isoform X1 [Marmota flaviventris]|uniref:synaptic vesicle membrane protein VAT-1 homolog-like isoform X1 n=2 Tax=Marmota flaviventris TaxID=93162 RepID=UPI003A83B478